MFHFSFLVLILSHQVVVSTSCECSSGTCKGEKCTITRTVQQNSLLWEKDSTTILSSTYQATNSCIPTAPNSEYVKYCFEDLPNYIFILEVIYPENHTGSTFTDTATTDTTTINFMEPDNLSSGDLITKIPDTISGDIVNVSVSVPCSKPQPTFTWNFQVSKSTTNYTIESNQTSTDNTGCTSSLSKWESLLTVDLNTWDPEITKRNGDIDISVDVKFCDCKKVSSSPVTVKYIAPGPHECYCYCLILVIIKVVLVVVAIILVIVHFCRKEAKAEGNVYWVLNVGFIIDGPVCFVLSIIQILYQIKAIACSRCMDRSGYDAAIALDVCGIISAIVCIVCFVIRLKQRGKKTLNKPTEMKKTDPENKVGETRPLPLPKSS